MSILILISIIVYFLSGMACADIFCRQGIRPSFFSALFLMLPVVNTIYVIYRFNLLTWNWTYWLKDFFRRL